MADDWTPGDLALCVGCGDDAVFRMTGMVPSALGPIAGLTYTVSAVRLAVDCFGREAIALRFIEIPTRHPKSVGYNACLFRKVSPYASDEQDEETIRLLNLVEA